jgi:hypothetical protein
MMPDDQHVPRNPDPALPPELKGLEAQLAALIPRDDRLNRDRLMFEAGRAAAAERPQNMPPHRWAWPASFAGMTTVAASLLAVLVFGGGERLSPSQTEQRDAAVAVEPPRRDHSLVLANAADLRQRLPLRWPHRSLAVYSAGMPLTSVDHILRPTPSQLAGAGAARNGQPIEPTPIFSSRSLMDALDDSFLINTRS